MVSVLSIGKSIERGQFVVDHFAREKTCRNACGCSYSFTILDSVPAKFQLKIKEALHIPRDTPAINQQIQYVN